MKNINDDELYGIQVTGCLVPCTSADNYPTHDSQYSLGGWHEVETIEQRNAIPAERRRKGMACLVRTENKLYILNNGLTNNSWIRFSGINEEDNQLIIDIIKEAIAGGSIEIPLDEYYTIDQVDSLIETSSGELNEAIQTLSNRTLSSLSQLNSDISSLERTCDDIGARCDDIGTRIDEISGEVSDNYYDKAVIDAKLQELEEMIETSSEGVTENEVKDIITSYDFISYNAEEIGDDNTLLPDSNSVLGNMSELDSTYLDPEKTLVENFNSLSNALKALEQRIAALEN